MFIGFIAVLVILLAIVGLMSSATTETSGQESAKAAKVAAEIMQIRQSAMIFYSSGEEIYNVSKSDSAGLFQANQFYTLQAADLPGFIMEYGMVPGDLGYAAGDKILVSKSVPGLYYIFGAIPSSVGIFIVKDPSLIPDDSSLAKALDKTFQKIEATESPDTYLSSTASDGLAYFVFID